MELTERLKELRQTQGLTLKALAKKSGISITYLNQIERGKSNPSIGTLRKIAAAMNTTFASLMGFEEASTPPGKNADNQVMIVRKDRRKALLYPGNLRKAFLLTPDLQRKLEVLLTQEEPQEMEEEEWYRHEGEEFGFIIEGNYEVTIENKTYLLNEGDSIYFPSHLPHKMRCIGEKKALTLWVITPPSF
ncbi:MAG: XRE family transcriptional regulator [Thermodesulfobacteriota bacterium]